MALRLSRLLGGQHAADAAEVAPPNTPAAFRKLLAREIQMWDKIVRASGIRVE